MVLTPKLLMVSARILILTIVLPLLVMTFMDKNGSASGAMVLGYVLACSAMIGFPRVRRSDILSSISVFLFGVELASYGSRAPGAWPGFACTVVGVLAALAPSYIRDLRSLARDENIDLNELRKLDRRSGAALPARIVRSKRVDPSKSDSVVHVAALGRVR